DDLPKCLDASSHIRDKENTEHTYYGVELQPRETQIKHITDPKLHVQQAVPCRLRTGPFKQFFRKIDAENEALWPHFLRSRNRRGPTPTTNIEDTRPRLEVKAFDRPTTEPLPKRVRRVVVGVSRCVVSRGGPVLRVGGCHHSPPLINLAKE